jgi:hypothetical protein
METLFLTGKATMPLKSQENSLILESDIPKENLNL